MKRYLYVLVLMLPLRLTAQLEEGSSGFDGAFVEDEGRKEKNSLEDEAKAFQNVIENFHFVYGMIGKEEGKWDFTFSNKSIFWGDALVKEDTKLLKAKNPKDLSQKVFSYIAEVQKGGSDFQYDFVLWKHPKGYSGYLIEIQDTSRLFCR